MKFEPVFRLSTYRNEEVLISEHFEHVPWIRIWMVIICFFLGLGTLIHLIIVYFRYKSVLKHGHLYRLIVPLILILNIILHVAHYSHNIYEPVGYFEPKKLYTKKFITEMEQTFFFNFPLTIVFIIATRKLIFACTNQATKSRSMLVFAILYCLMSMISGGHYTYEPPRNFDFIYNVTIAGETILAFILMVIAIGIYQLNLNHIVDYKYVRVASEETSDSSMAMTQERRWKSKMSDDE